MKYYVNDVTSENNYYKACQWGSWSYCVIYNKPLKIALYGIYIECPIYAGFHVFNNEKDAYKFVYEKSLLLKGYNYYITYKAPNKIVELGLTSIYANNYRLFSHIDDRCIYVY